MGMRPAVLCFPVPPHLSRDCWGLTCCPRLRSCGAGGGHPGPDGGCAWRSWAHTSEGQPGTGDIRTHRAELTVGPQHRAGVCNEPQPVGTGVGEAPRWGCSGTFSPISALREVGSGLDILPGPSWGVDISAAATAATATPRGSRRAQAVVLLEGQRWSVAAMAVCLLQPGACRCDVWLQQSRLAGGRAAIPTEGGSLPESQCNCCLLIKKQGEKLSALLPEWKVTLFLTVPQLAFQMHIPPKTVLPTGVSPAACSMQWQALPHVALAKRYLQLASSLSWIVLQMIFWTPGARRPQEERWDWSLPGKSLGIWS